MSDEDKLEKARDRIRRLGLHHHKDGAHPEEQKRPEVGKFTLAELPTLVSPTIGKQTSPLPTELPELPRRELPRLDDVRPRLPVMSKATSLFDGANLQLDPENKIAPVVPVVSVERDVPQLDVTLPKLDTSLAKLPRLPRMPKATPTNFVSPLADGATEPQQLIAEQRAKLDDVQSRATSRVQRVVSKATTALELRLDIDAQTSNEIFARGKTPAPVQQVSSIQQRMVDALGTTSLAKIAPQLQQPKTLRQQQPQTPSTPVRPQRQPQLRQQLDPQPDNQLRSDKLPPQSNQPQSDKPQQSQSDNQLRQSNQPQSDKLPSKTPQSAKLPRQSDKQPRQVPSRVVSPTTARRSRQVTPRTTKPVQQPVRPPQRGDAKSTQAKTTTADPSTGQLAPLPVTDTTTTQLQAPTDKVDANALLTDAQRKLDGVTDPRQLRARRDEADQQVRAAKQHHQQQSRHGQQQQHQRRNRAHGRANQAKNHGRKHARTQVDQQAQQLEQVKQQAIESITRHADLAIAALSKSFAEEKQDLEKGFEAQNTKIDADLVAERQKADAKVIEEQGLLDTQHDQILANIDKDCDKQTADTTKQIKTSETERQHDGDTAAKQAIADGETEAKQLIATGKQLAAGIRRDAKSEAATIIREANAEAAKAESRASGGTQQADGHERAKQIRLAAKGQANERIQKGERDAQAEIDKWQKLADDRRASAQDASDKIKQDTKDAIDALELGLGKLLANIKDQRDKGKALADQRWQYDRAQIKQKVDDGYADLARQLEDSRLSLRQNLDGALAELASTDQTKKDAVKADIQKTKDDTIAKLKAAKGKQLLAVLKEVGLADQAIDTSMNQISLAASQEISMLANGEQMFHAKAQQISAEVDAAFMAAIQHQQQVGKGVNSAMKRVAIETDDTVERVKTLQNKQIALRQYEAMLDESNKADPEIQKQLQEQRNDINRDKYALTDETGWGARAMFIDAYRDFAQQDFDKQKTDDAAAEQQRQMNLDTLKTADHPDGRPWNEAIRQAKAKELNEKFGDFYNDTRGMMQILATMTPDQLREVLADPVYGAAIQARIGQMSGGDKQYVDQMIGAKTPEEMHAAAVTWALYGGITGAGTDVQTIKNAYDGLSDKEREALNAEFKRQNNGQSIEDAINTQWLGRENNNTLIAYTKSSIAGWTAEQVNATRGGWMRDTFDFIADHDPTGIVDNKVVRWTFDQMQRNTALVGSTDWERYSLYREKVMRATTPPPMASEEEKRAFADKRATALKQMNDEISERTNGEITSVEQLDTYATTKQEWGANQYYDRMLKASREYDADAYWTNKALAGSTELMGNRKWMIDAQREMYADPARKAKFDAAVARESPDGTFEGFVKTNVWQPIDQEMIIRASKNEMTPAMKLIYSQFGGRTGVGTDKQLFEETLANIPKEQREQVLEEYARLAKQFGLVDRRQSYNPVDYFFGQWSTGDLRQDIELMDGAEWSRWTDGVIGQGSDYRKHIYDLDNGKSVTAREQYLRSKAFADFDLQGAWTQNEEATFAKREMDRLDAAYKELEKAGIADIDLLRTDPRTLTEQQRDAIEKYAEEFQTRRETTDTWIDGSKHRNAEFVEGVGWVVGTAVGVVVIVASWGSATPVVLGVMGAIAGGLATMGVKRVMLGDNYDGKMFQGDAIQTITDAVCAGMLSAEGFTKFAKNLVERLGVEGPIASKILEEMIKNAAASGVNLTPALLDERTYAGSPSEVLARLRGMVAKAGASTVIGSVTTGVTERSLNGTRFAEGSLERQLIVANSQNAATFALEIDPSAPLGEQLFAFVKATSKANIDVLTQPKEKEKVVEPTESKPTQAKPTESTIERRRDGVVVIDETKVGELLREAKRRKATVTSAGVDEQTGRQVFTIELQRDGKVQTVKVTSRTKTSEPRSPIQLGDGSSIEQKPKQPQTFESSKQEQQPTEKQLPKPIPKPNTPLETKTASKPTTVVTTEDGIQRVMLEDGTIVERETLPNGKTVERVIVEDKGYDQYVKPYVTPGKDNIFTGLGGREYRVGKDDVFGGIEKPQPRTKTMDEANRKVDNIAVKGEMFGANEFEGTCFNVAVRNAISAELAGLPSRIILMTGWTPTVGQKLLEHCNNLALKMFGHAVGNMATAQKVDLALGRMLARLDLQHLINFLDNTGMSRNSGHAIAEITMPDGSLRYVSWGKIHTDWQSFAGSIYSKYKMVGDDDVGRTILANNTHPLDEPSTNVLQHRGQLVELGYTLTGIGK